MAKKMGITWKTLYVRGKSAHKCKTSTLHMVDTEYDNTFVAQQVIMDYLEKHFHRKASRTKMHKELPMLRHTVTKPLVVNPFVKDYLKSRFPKHEDGELAKFQYVMLKVCSAMTCL